MGDMTECKGFDFSYCDDESQTVARTCETVCTPDIFLFATSPSVTCSIKWKL